MRAPKRIGKLRPQQRLRVAATCCPVVESEEAVRALADSQIKLRLFGRTRGCGGDIRLMVCSRATWVKRGQENMSKSKRWN